MPARKGAELIADYLIQEGMPYVFGICGHGNVGMLDALYDRQDKIALISPRTRASSAMWRRRAAISLARAGL